MKTPNDNLTENLSPVTSDKVIKATRKLKRMAAQQLIEEIDELFLADKFPATSIIRRVRDMLIEQDKQIAELNEVVEKLPRLADGKVAFFGMDVWCTMDLNTKIITSSQIRSIYQVGFTMEHIGGLVSYDCAYSTLAGAEAAVREMKGGE